MPVLLHKSMKQVMMVFLIVESQVLHFKACFSYSKTAIEIFIFFLAL